jgi:lipopolysaccharide export LptBFGC system permease protein LptF
MFKVTQIIARGGAWEATLLVLWWSLIEAFALAIPVSALVASLLSFSRMASDSEILAMASCGASKWQILSRPLLFSVLLTAACLYIHNELVPRGHYNRRTTMAMLGVISPVDLIDEGRFIYDFEKISMYVGRKKGNKLYEIIICDSTNDKLPRQIRAKHGIVKLVENSKDILLELYDVKIDSLVKETSTPATAEKCILPIKNVLKTNAPKKSEKDLNFSELWTGIQYTEYVYPMLNTPSAVNLQKNFLAIEFHKRITLSLACIAFVIVGVALGIKTHRKESWLGIIIALGVILFFYIFTLLAQSLSIYPELKPYLILWFPILLCSEIGLRLLNS